MSTILSHNTHKNIYIYDKNPTYPYIYLQEIEVRIESYMERHYQIGFFGTVARNAIRETIRMNIPENEMKYILGKEQLCVVIVLFDKLPKISIIEYHGIITNISQTELEMMVIGKKIYNII